VRTQIRACGILVVAGAVLVENPVGTDIWYLPGGRLEEAETLQIAVRRVFQEEIGLSVACDELGFVNENFFPLGGDIIREYGFYFHARALDIGIGPASPIVSKAAKVRHTWTPIERLHEIPFRPVALIQHLVDPPGGTLYLETRDATLMGAR